MTTGTGRPDIVWRPARAADDAFLLQLYADTRAPELAATGWDTATYDAFMRMQFDLQRRAYRASHPASVCHVVCIADTGEPIGRVWVAEADTELRLLDISLLPAWRGQGIGGACVTALQAQARSRALALGLHVEMGNRARRLYERLGLVAFDAQGLHIAMRWVPPTDSPTVRSQETMHEQA
jgi:GNAT superfamily N-acetyltransferase